MSTYLTEETEGKIRFRLDMPKIRCQFVVYDDPDKCGVGIVNEDNAKIWAWGLRTPRDLIASWRAVEILRKIGKADPRFLEHAYYAGIRNQQEIHSQHTAAIKFQIGVVAYENVFIQRIPEIIIRAILDNQTNEYKPDLYPIEEEIAAGTIVWREEFARFGIKKQSMGKPVSAESSKPITQKRSMLSRLLQGFGEKKQ